MACDPDGPTQHHDFRHRGSAKRIDRASRHGRVLCVGRALPFRATRVSAVAIGGGRRHQPQETIDPATGASTRTFATLPITSAAGWSRRRPTRRRALGLHSAMGLMKASDAPHRTRCCCRSTLRRAIADIRGCSRPPCATIASRNRGSRHRRDLHRPDRRAPPGTTRRGRRPRLASDRWRRARRRQGDQATRCAARPDCRARSRIAPNKLLAKIASELDKPDGLHAAPPMTDVADARSGRCRARRINGIGPKSAREARSARHPYDRRARAAADPGVARSSISARITAPGCTRLRTVATSVRSSPTASRKSISRETTFERDLHPHARSRRSCPRIFTELCVGVERRPRSARATSAGRSASSSATTISRR